MFCILTFSEHVLCQISTFVCRRVTRVLNYYSTKFHEILTSYSVEISAFLLNHAVTIFWLTAHALHLRGFSIFLDPYNPRKAGYFPKVLPLMHWKTNVFHTWQTVWLLRRKKHLHNLHWIKWNDRCTGAIFVFLKLCARANSRQQYKS